MEKTVLSASRRTDVPAFYMNDFMKGLNRGFFIVENPFNAIKRKIVATKENVHSIVFWSKNYGPFIEGHYDQILKNSGLNLFFNFTVNSPVPLLEPRLPPVNERLEQLGRLVDAFGPEAVNWRFDPVCFYTIRPSDIMRSNLDAFEYIAERASGFGIKRCITSFMDHYPKVLKRARIKGEIFFHDPADGQKAQTLLKMERFLKPLNISLYLCCESNLFAHLPLYTSIRESACIDGELLQKLYGPGAPLKKDYGQRRKKGCRCTISSDVGSYRKHPCFHNCLYCYANPKNT